MQQLQIPHPVTTDPDAPEIARIFVAHRQQFVALQLVWDDPAAWGILLADFMRHVANAYHDSAGRDPIETLERIMAGLNAERERPTDAPTTRRGP